MSKSYSQKPVRNAGVASASVNEGLRAYLVKVYQFMSLGLGLTGVTAFFVSTSPALMNALIFSPLHWVVILAPLGIVIFLSAKIDTLQSSTAQTLFWVYSALMGVGLSTIFMTYTGESITRVFLVTSITFGATSLYGYTTKRDLSAFGSFLVMALIGLVVASLVNLFIQSTMLQLVLSYVGVLIFTGLTAYDTQSIKENYYAHDGEEVATKKAIFGALRLYLDFINLFISLLRIMGDRR